MDGTGAGSGFVVDWYWMVVDGSGLRKEYRKLQIFAPYKTCGYAWIDLWICLDRDWICLDGSGLRAFFWFLPDKNGSKTYFFSLPCNSKEVYGHVAPLFG